MKNKLIQIMILALSCYTIAAQDLRYFEFTTDCGHGNWQDTSFIAGTDNQSVIDSVLADLQRPMEERKFIAGSISHGNGGFNHNAGHWFLWHFIPGEWDLAEMAIEVCDGCPYSDVDADTAYWIGNLGNYCPWSGKVKREVSQPTSVGMPKDDAHFNFFPNPARGDIYIQYTSDLQLTISLISVTGDLLKIYSAKNGDQIVLPDISDGIYFLRLNDGNRISTKLLEVR